MPRDGSGNYSLPAGNPVVTKTTSNSTYFNNTMSDLATEMQDSLSRSGKGGMTGPFKTFDGTVSAPGLSFANEASSGLYRAGAGDVRLSVLGTQRLQVTADGIAVNGLVNQNTRVKDTVAVDNTSLGGTFTVWSAVTGATITVALSKYAHKVKLGFISDGSGNNSYVDFKLNTGTAFVMDFRWMRNVNGGGATEIARFRGWYGIFSSGNYNIYQPLSFFDHWDLNPNSAGSPNSTVYYLESLRASGTYDFGIVKAKLYCVEYGP